MAIENGMSRRRSVKDEAKAIGFINVFIATAGGKRKKVGSMAFQGENATHEQIDKFLRDNPDDGLERLLSRLEMEYNPVDDTPPDLGLDSL